MSSAIGVSYMLVSLGGVSTGSTLLPHIGAKAPTLAKARLEIGGGEERARGSMQCWQEAEAFDKLVNHERLRSVDNIQKKKQTSPS